MTSAKSPPAFSIQIQISSVRGRTVFQHVYWANLSAENSSPSYLCLVEGNTRFVDPWTDLGSESSG